MKDGSADATDTSRLEVVTIGVDQDGDDVTSCILREVEGSTNTKAKVKVPPSAKVALDLLWRAIVDAGRSLQRQINIPPNTRTISLSLWRSYCDRGTVAKSDKPDTLRKAFAGLLNASKPRGSSAFGETKFGQQDGNYGYNHRKREIQPQGFKNGTKTLVRRHSAVSAKRSPRATTRTNPFLLLSGLVVRLQPLGNTGSLDDLHGQPDKPDKGRTKGFCPATPIAGRTRTRAYKKRVRLSGVRPFAAVPVPISPPFLSFICLADEGRERTTDFTDSTDLEPARATHHRRGGTGMTNPFAQMEARARRDFKRHAQRLAARKEPTRVIISFGLALEMLFDEGSRRDGGTVVRRGHGRDV